MREIFYIDDTPVNKISYYLLLVFLVSLPFDRIYSELALIGLLLHTVIHIDRQQLTSLWAEWRERWGGKSESESGSQGNPGSRWRSPGLLVMCLYLLTMAGTLYSVQRNQAWGEWEKQLALLLFPLIFLFTRLDPAKYRQSLFKAFSFSCLATVIYLYVAALRIIRQEGLPLSALFRSRWLSHHFTAAIDLHATYFSMYVTMALVYFAWLVIHSPRALYRWLYLLGAFILLAGLLQLASRAVFMALLLIFNIILPYFMLKGVARKKFIFVSLALTALSLLAVTRNDNFRIRYIDQLGKDLHSKTGEPDIPEPRMARWRCAWELIRQSPYIGYGTGAETGLLKAKYYEHHLYDSYDKGLNAHNQYLSFWLKTGLLGLLLYLYILKEGCRQAFRRRDPFLMSFVVVVAMVSLSENILDMNKGIFFFGFFFSFLLLTPALPAFVPHYGNKNILPLVGA